MFQEIFLYLRPLTPLPLQLFFCTFYSPIIRFWNMLQFKIQNWQIWTFNLLHSIIDFCINIYKILHFLHNLLMTFCPKISQSMINFALISGIAQICNFLKISKITQEHYVLEQKVINKMCRKCKVTYISSWKRLLSCKIIEVYNFLYLASKMCFISRRNHGGKICTKLQLLRQKS